MEPMFTVSAAVKDAKNVRPPHLTIESAARAAQSIARIHRCTMIVRNEDGTIVRKYDRSGTRTV